MGQTTLVYSGKGFAQVWWGDICKNELAYVKYCTNFYCKNYVLINYPVDCSSFICIPEVKDSNNTLRLQWPSKWRRKKCICGKFFLVSLPPTPIIGKQSHPLPPPAWFVWYLDIGIGRVVYRLWDQRVIYCALQQFTCINSYHNSMKEILLFPFYRWSN